jgi:3'-phosphoadenosine 5'-phosphosulfate sulfotransferase (PAPS reductase)/FAD synthetase
LLYQYDSSGEYELTLVFCNTGLEYPEIVAFVPRFADWLRGTYGFPVTLEILRPESTFRQIVTEYGYPVVSKEFSRAVYYARGGSVWALQKLDGNFKDGTPADRYQRYVKYKYMMNAPFPVSDQCCEEMKKKPFKSFESQSGLHPITGMTAEESFMRQSVWMKNGCNAYDGKRAMSSPLSFWKEQDILKYLKINGIPYAPVYGEITEDKEEKLETTGCRRTGCYPCMYGIQNDNPPNRYELLKKTHPKLYNYSVETLGCGAVLDYMNIKY